MLCSIVVPNHMHAHTRVLMGELGPAGLDLVILCIFFVILASPLFFGLVLFFFVCVFY